MPSSDRAGVSHAAINAFFGQYAGSFVGAG
jgi:hypothetical protein